MRAIFNILTVSKYESKTLFRSWFFRIFSVLTLVFVFLFNLITQTGIGMPNGDMIALPSRIPFFNLYIINIAQAIIAVFLASDFLKRDKKLDTTEVIYMRSMTNADYVIGKTLGNIWVFFILNFIALGIVAVFNLASPFTHFFFAPYLYYFFLISLPTLIFILGFSFFLMSVIKNQAVTFVILLGYIAATLFYLQNIYHYLFDYMAFHLPMAYSDFVGFASLKEILIHRGIYLFLGLGFIGLTIILLQRLSQSRTVRIATIVTSIVCLVVGLNLGYQYIVNINQNDNHRAEMLELNNKYATSPLVTVKSYNLSLVHSGNKISVEAGLLLINQNQSSLSEIILTLNPGFTVTSVSGATFQQELQLLKLKPATPLVSGGELPVNVSYSGSVDETFCYLDMTRERLEVLMKRGEGLADQRYAFISSNYLLLTPETRWYPTPGISYSNQGLKWQTMQFSDFHLKVKTNPGLTVISQGEMSDHGDGSVDFAAQYPLPQLSLAIGKYVQRSLQVDSVKYTLSFLDGHNNFDPYFKNLADSLVPVIRDLKKSWETKVRSEYPYKQLNLVEVPVQFCSFSHVWSGASEQVQPETVYLPEGGFKLSAANFALQKKQSSRMGGHENETLTPREEEENYFKRFVNETFLSSQTSPFRSGGIRMGRPSFGTTSNNPYFIFPQYYTYLTRINSEQYPIINRVMESYLSKAATETGNSFMRNFTGLSENEKGNIALQSASFAEILDQQNDPDIIDHVVTTKSGFLFSLMKGAVEADDFDEFIHNYINEKRFETFPLDSLNTELKNSFQLDLNQYLTGWYSSSALPGYVFSSLNAVKIKKGDQIKTLVTFVVSNTEPVAGVVSVSFRMGSSRRGGGFRSRGGGSSDDNLEKTVLIGGKESKRVTYILNKEPRSITFNTYASHNIPSTISTQFGKIETDEKLIATQGEEVIPYTEGEEPGVMIADNEDPGFVISKPKSTGFLQKILTPSEEQSAPDNLEKTVKKSLSSKSGKSKSELKYKGMIFWNPPLDWTLTTNEQFYGKQIRSAYYLKGGNGDRTATWNIPLKVAGYYKIWAYIPQISSGFGRPQKSNSDYDFTIYGDDGEEHQVVNVTESDGGWMEIGSYHFSPDTVKIVLSNLSKARTIYADAVKLIKEN